MSNVWSISAVSRLRWYFLGYWRCVPKIPQNGEIFVKKNKNNGPQKLPPWDKLRPKKKDKLGVGETGTKQDRSKHLGAHDTTAKR